MRTWTYRERGEGDDNEYLRAFTSTFKFLRVPQSTISYEARNWEFILSRNCLKDSLIGFIHDLIILPFLFTGWVNQANQCDQEQSQVGNKYNWFHPEITDRYDTSKGRRHDQGGRRWSGFNDTSLRLARMNEQDARQIKSSVQHESSGIQCLFPIPFRFISSDVIHWRRLWWRRFANLGSWHHRISINRITN